MLHKRNIRAASRKNSVVLTKVTDELEVLFEPGAMQHMPSVATYGEYFSRFDVVMRVENKAVYVIRYRAAINHRLAVIFTSRLQPFQFEQPISRGKEFDVAYPFCQLGIGHV